MKLVHVFGFITKKYEITFGIMTRLFAGCMIDKGLLNSRHAKEIIVSFRLARPDESPIQHSTQRLTEALLNEVN